MCAVVLVVVFVTAFLGPPSLGRTIAKRNRVLGLVSAYFALAGS